MRAKFEFVMLKHVLINKNSASNRFYSKGWDTNTDRNSECTFQVVHDSLMKRVEDTTFARFKFLT